MENHTEHLTAHWTRDETRLLSEPAALSPDSHHVMTPIVFFCAVTLHTLPPYLESLLAPCSPPHLLPFPTVCLGPSARRCLRPLLLLSPQVRSTATPGPVLFPSQIVRALFPDPPRLSFSSLTAPFHWSDAAQSLFTYNLSY